MLQRSDSQVVCVLCEEIRISYNSRALLRTLSSLLDPRYQTAWADLANTEEALRRFMEVTEAVILTSPPVDFYSTPNICKYHQS